jgi:diamine N-acetyltransferase
MEFKGLEGKYIRLRAMEPADLDLLYKWENDSENWALGNTLTPYSLFTLDEFVRTASYDLQTTRQARLIIVNRKNSQPAGAIDLFDIDFVHRRAGIGILIDKDYRKQGLASECIRMITEYAFGMLNLAQLYCHITDDNRKSKKLFEKNGFKKSGCLKKWITHSGKSHDVFIYQKLNIS